MDPPVPIPNTVVKHFSADDTRLETVWENKPLPGLFPTFARRWGFLYYFSPFLAVNPRELVRWVVDHPALWQQSGPSNTADDRRSECLSELQAVTPE